MPPDPPKAPQSCPKPRQPYGHLMERNPLVPKRKGKSLFASSSVRPSSMVVSLSRSNDAGMRRDANTARFEVAAVCKAHGVENLLGRFHADAELSSDLITRWVWPKWLDRHH